MELYLKRIIEAFIVAPGLMIALIILGVLLRNRLYRTAQVLILTGFISLILASLPAVSGGLTRFYENVPPLTEVDLKKPEANAIVILGAGRYSAAPEFEKRDTVSETALERIRYGAYIQRKTGLPIMVAGGMVYTDDTVPESRLMQRTLEQDFVAKVRWVEGESRTTFANAVHARTQLAEVQIDKIYLVTHALHMPRAREAFEQAGFDVIPAPMGFNTASNQPSLFNFLPSAHAMHETSRLMHEVIGRVWYRLRYY